jgi:hypothetical protein
VGLSFAHLNLFRNPFGELEPAERARIAVVELPPWIAGCPLQIVGESGRGKTTHLLALARTSAAVRWVRLEEGDDRVDDPDPAGDLVVDEAQRLSRRRRKTLLARPGRLALGTHEDLSRLAPMRTILLRGLSPEKLEAIVRRRIEHVRRGDGPLPEVMRAEIESLLARHGDDLRAIESELYDRFQSA